ncbi:hypothetical protein ACH41E_02050 [Streptomyces sp. NPDC020412]
MKEGRDAWQGKGCCVLAASAPPSATSPEADACGCRANCDCC